MAATAKSAARRWVAKAEIDYMTHYVTAWITFNAWYTRKYSKVRGDRARIKKIACDPSGGVARAIEYFIERGAQPCVEFRNHLSRLYNELEQIQLDYKGRHLSFDHILGCESEIQSSPTKFSKEKAILKLPDNFYECDGYYFVRDPSHLLNPANVMVKALVFILYQLRNRLFHGDLNPKDDLQAVYKHAYFILLAIDHELAK